MERTSDRIRALAGEASDLAEQSRTATAERQRLEKQRDMKIAALRLAEAELDRSTREIANTDERIAELERRAAAQRPEIQDRLVDLYKLGQAGYARLLLNVQDLRRAGRAYRVVSQLARRDHQRVQEHRATLEALSWSRQRLLEQRARRVAIRAEAAQARQDIEEAILAQTQTIQQLDARRDRNTHLTGQLQQTEQRLQASLAVLRLAGQPTDRASLPLRLLEGVLDWPVLGRVSSEFGHQRSDASGATSTRNGIEIAAPKETPVHAVHAGEVVYADPFENFGNLVVVEHGDGAYTLYGYLSSMTVASGTRVAPGALVGTVGRDPSGDARLYFEIRIDDQATDPLQWLEIQGDQ